MIVDRLKIRRVALPGAQFKLLVIIIRPRIERWADGEREYDLISFIQSRLTDRSSKSSLDDDTLGGF